MQKPYISARMPGCPLYTLGDNATHKSITLAQSRGCIIYGGPTGYSALASFIETFRAHQAVGGGGGGVQTQKTKTK